MSTLTNIIDRYTRLEQGAREWLRRLTLDWQILADLAFADLVLWLPTDDGDYVAAGQCRPGTGPTIYYTDIVGTLATAGRAAAFDQARAKSAVISGRDSRWGEDVDISEEIIPVAFRGDVIGLVTRQSSQSVTRTPSRLELNYVEIADELAGMICRGEFPATATPTAPPRHAPRVGDGLLSLNAEGEILYASPNALSVAHRIGIYGNMIGSSLVDL
ncbi:MAG: histidine kinase N-terminal domain-containing protein, partial [Bifidobacteriaceae bacterium]|nr:histidine kinase N-terminal domain-containing protein [Bifidobacteriaceae bacterium]